MKFNLTGGCLSKLPALKISKVLENVYCSVSGNPYSNPMRSPEDCAVITTSNEVIFASVDMAPGVTDDPILNGRIATLHAMSDIYASGGVPYWALVQLIVDAAQDLVQTEKIMTGILQACNSEGAQIIGGHTTLGIESNIGLTILGTPRSEIILRKKGANVGEKLFLSKPLGSGLVMRSAARNTAPVEAIQHAISVMECSNSAASSIAVSAGVSAATDISGFGLLGHLSEMLSPGLGACLHVPSIPLMKGISSLEDAIYDAGCLDENLSYTKKKRELIGNLSKKEIALLVDPQTNGGLLVSAGTNAGIKLEAGGFSCIGSVISTEKIEFS